jgi:hypothetical protein
VPRSAPRGGPISAVTANSPACRAVLSRECRTVCEHG